MLAICIWAVATPLLAQTTPRPTTSTVNGDTGLWFTPTADILPARRWAISANRVSVDRDEGFTNISSWPLTFGVGVRDRFEIFGALAAVTRIDRDLRPLFLPGSRAGGVVNEYPFVRSGWTGSHFGDVWIGTKVDIRPERRSSSAAFGVRAMVKIPTAPADAGIGTGRLDAAADAIVSREIDDRIEMTGFAGFILRGDPDGFDLSNGVRWGFGAALPSRGALRLTTELTGEVYTRSIVDAPGSPVPAFAQTAGGDTAPRSSAQVSPLNTLIGLTWIGDRGFFAGVGLNWNLRLKGRSESGPYKDRPGDALGLELRVGFHSGRP